LLRVALTACTGEETVLVWKLALTGLPGLQQQEQQPSGPLQQQQTEQQLSDALQQQQQHEQKQQEQAQGQQAVQAAQHPDPQPQEDPAAGSHSPGASSSSTSSSSDSSDTSDTTSSSSSSQGPVSKACWQVVSITQEAFSAEDTDLPASPHPRVPPELIVRAQLQALRQQQLLKACGFNLMGRHASSSAWEAHLTAFRQLLQQPHYRLLGAHAAAELGQSALPSQRQFLQEVVLTGAGSQGGEEGSSGRFLWRVGMQADGCWMVRSNEVLCNTPGSLQWAWSAWCD
jgi:hypothetical protein